MSPSPSAFGALVGRLDYPMAIVTAAVGGRRSGCLVGFSTQCSIHPPRYLVCISKENRTFDVAVDAGWLAVHFPAAGQRGLAELFGSETGDVVDKFERCRWRPAGEEATPVLEDVDDWFVGRVADRADLGDHVAFVLDVVDASAGSDEGRLLTYQSVKDIPPGHPA